MSDRARTEEHRRLTARLFEPLAPIATFQPVGDGWTCDTYRVNGDWIVQFARSDMGAVTLRTQMDVLPELAREVSARIPLPELISRDPAAMAYRRIDGAEPAGSDGNWPERLGRFLYDLHMVPPEFVGMRDHGPSVLRASLGNALVYYGEVVFPHLTVSERELFRGRFRRFMDSDRNWQFSPCVTPTISSAHTSSCPKAVTWSV